MLTVKRERSNCVINSVTAVSNFWQLPTAVLLMFIAGGLLWANMHKHEREVEYSVSGDSYDPVVKTFYVTGWPFHCIAYDPPDGIIHVLYEQRIARYSGPAICANVLIGIGLLALVSFVLERLINRLPAKKGSS
jgi:hypothetical protein